VGIVLVAMGVGVVVASAIMGRVCTDAKVPALQNFRELPFFSGLPSVLNVAHRGASTLALEHSLAAYELALQHTSWSSICACSGTVSWWSRTIGR
jgi:hypothetical protein